jgi:hypothetical protein
MLVVYRQTASPQKIFFAFFANSLGDKGKKVVLVQNLKKNSYAYDSNIYSVTTPEDQTKGYENRHNRCRRIVYFTRCSVQKN